MGNTDWSKELYRPGNLEQTNLSMSGGGNNVTYYMGYGLLTQRGFLASYNDRFKRQNFNFNVSADVTKWLTFSGKVRYTYSDEDHPGGGSANSGINATSGQLKGDLRPILPVYNPDGNFAGQGTITNPFAVAALGGHNGTKVNDLWLTGAVQMKPLPGLNINVDYTFNPYSNNNEFTSKTYREYHADGSYNLYPWTNPSRVRQTNSNDYYYALNAYADYSKTIARDHNFKLLVGYNQEQKFQNNFSADRQNLVINDDPNLNLATGLQTITQATTSWAISGAFARLNYDYKGKYLLELNTRYDGSSKFPTTGRTVVLPSASAAWRISQEGFWKNSFLGNAIPEFKLRGSYGVLGNQNVSGNFPYLSNYGVNTALSYLLGSTTTLPVSVSPGGLISPTFTWEKVYQWNLGLDADFLQNRLSTTVEVYSRNNKGMLVNGQPLPAVLGTGVPQSNAADERTQGYEVALKWHDRIGNDFSYHVDIAFSDAFATVTKFSNPTGDLTNSARYVGKREGEIYGYQALGLFQSAAEVTASPSQSLLYGGVWNPGDVRYADLNGDGKIGPGKNTLSDPGDQKIIGNTTPRYQYSLITGMNWKRFDMDIMLQGVGKKDFIPDGRFFGIGNEFDVPMALASDFWSPTNTNAYLPRPYLNGGHGNRATSDRYLQSAAYLRLKQLTFGYSFPTFWASKIGLSKLRIYVTGQNLLTFTKLSKLYDPENLNVQGYPYTKSYSVGLNASF